MRSTIANRTAVEPLRVLFDAHHIGSGKTGNETYARELLAALGARAEVRLTAAVTAHSRHGIGLGVSTHDVPTNGWLRLLALGRARGFDLVHSMYYLPIGRRRPTVVSIHDVSYERHPEFFSRTEVWKNRVLVRRAAERATMVVTLSEHARREMITLYGLDPDRIAVVPGGVSGVFRTERGARAQGPGGCARRRILAVGTLQPRKNLLRLLDAVRLVANRTTVEFRVVGPPGHAGAQIRDRLGEGTEVKLLGYVDDAALRREYRDADVFVYPSIYEGFGLPVVEAMALGTPVVTTTGGSLPEVAGDAAMIVDPYDVAGMAAAIDRVLHEESLRARLVQRGYERAALYTWDASANGLLDVYRRAVSA